MQSAINYRQNGSALIAVIAFLVLASVFLSLGLDFLQLRSPQEDRRRTISDANIIVAELSSYVQKNNRIPCPADPTLLPTNANYGTEAKPSPTASTCNLIEGLVPVRALYLSESFMKDSWGRYFTYAVSPVYADTPTSVSIYNNCRIINLWVFSGFNINPNKAKFCCPDITVYPTISDLMVSDLSGTQAFVGRVGFGYGDPNTPTVPSSPSESAAIVIVSHGANGSSAFLPDGSGGKYAASLSANEAENGDSDREFIAGLSSNEPGNYFDDIVLYKSQLQLMAQTNDGSCMRPFFSYTPDLLKPKHF